MMLRMNEGKVERRSPSINDPVGCCFFPQRSGAEQLRSDRRVCDRSLLAAAHSRTLLRAAVFFVCSYRTRMRMLRCRTEMRLAPALLSTPIGRGAHTARVK